MQNSTPTPHDAIFKTFLSNSLLARNFLELHLPEPLLAICDLNTLRLESGSFIEDDLRACYSDILYSLKTTRGDGYAYVLIEHQSSPDRIMPFRLMRYAIAAMQRHLDAGHKTLPLVIPVLFYQGSRSPYPFSTNWLDLFDEPELAAKLYGGGFPLVDITVIPDEEIRKHRKMALLTLLQKHIRLRDLLELFNDITSLMQSEDLTGQQQTALINYMIQAGETPDINGFLDKLAQALPQHKDELMTIAKRLEQIGREQGIEQGLQQGIAKGHEDGEREASLKIARNMLAKGFDYQAVIEMTGLTQDDLQQIKH